MITKYLLMGLGATTIAATGAAIAVPLVMKSQYEKGLRNFMDRGNGHVADFQKDQKLTYIALGDSITSGYNGFYHSGQKVKTSSEDYISYADFFANDLNKAGLLKDYKNYAKAGATIPNLSELVTESQGANHTLKEADLITVSISSNDLLNGARAFGIPFSTKISEIMGNVQDPNELRDKLMSIDNGDKLGPQPTTTSKGVGDSATSYLLDIAGKELAGALYGGRTAGLLRMDDTFATVMLDVIKRGLMTLTRDLHQAAPNAHIKFIMPEYPLLGVSDSLNFDQGTHMKQNDDGSDTLVKDNGGKSVYQYFTQDFAQAIKDGIKAQYTSFDTFDNGFKSFIGNMDGSIANFKKEIRDAKAVKQKYLDTAHKATAYMFFKNRKPDTDPNKGTLKDTLIYDLKRPTDTFPNELTGKVDPNKTMWEDLSDHDKGVLSFLKGNIDKGFAIGASLGYVSGIFQKKAKAIDDKVAYFTDEINQIKDIQNRYKGISDVKEKTSQIIEKEFMNDYADIHPSTRGHQVFGNYLFSTYVSQLSSKVSTPESMYTMATKFVDDDEITPFEELDQVDWAATKADGGLIHLANPDFDKSTTAQISRGISTMFAKGGPDADPITKLLNIIDPLLNGDKDKVVYYKLGSADKKENVLAPAVESTTMGGFDIKSLLNPVLGAHDLVKTLGNIFSYELFVNPNHANTEKELKKLFNGVTVSTVLNVNPKQLKTYITKLMKANGGSEISSTTALDITTDSKDPVVLALADLKAKGVDLKTVGDLVDNLNKGAMLDTLNLGIGQLAEQLNKDPKALDDMKQLAIEAGMPQSYIDSFDQVAANKAAEDVKLKAQDAIRKNAFAKLTQGFADVSTYKVTDIKQYMPDEGAIHTVQSALKGSSLVVGKTEDEVQALVDAYYATVNTLHVGATFTNAFAWAERIQEIFGF